MPFVFADRLQSINTIFWFPFPKSFFFDTGREILVYLSQLYIHLHSSTLHSPRPCLCQRLESKFCSIRYQRTLICPCGVSTLISYVLRFPQNWSISKPRGWNLWAIGLRWVWTMKGFGVGFLPVFRITGGRSLLTEMMLNPRRNLLWKLALYSSLIKISWFYYLAYLL